MVEMQNQKNFDWKNHPIVVAALASAGGFAFAFTYIIPIYTTELQTELRHLQAEEKLLQAEVKLRAETAAAAEEKLKSLTLANEDAYRRLQEAQLSGLYAPGSPYPLGLGKLKIGDSIDNIYKVYKAESIQKSKENEYEVRREHTLFDIVGYEYDIKSPRREIVRIMFRASSLSIHSNIVAGRLIESIGSPASNPEKDWYCWNLKQGYSVYIITGSAYQLMVSRFSPRLWPDAGCIEKK